METTTRRTRTRAAAHLALAVVTLATWLSAAHRAAAVVAEVEVAAADQVGGPAMISVLPLVLVVVVVGAWLAATTTGRRARG